MSNWIVFLYLYSKILWLWRIEKKMYIWICVIKLLLFYVVSV